MLYMFIFLIYINIGNNFFSKKNKGLSTIIYELSKFIIRFVSIWYFQPIECTYIRLTLYPH